jgi:hypothetical protein
MEMRKRSFGLLRCLAIVAVAAVGGCTHPARLTIYDYSLRPAGYGWAPHRIAHTRSVEYYGVDPQSGRTVYVGPDGIYYTFAHPPPITTQDLRSYWDPHDAAVSGSAPSAGQRRGAPRRSI